MNRYFLSGVVHDKRQSEDIRKFSKPHIGIRLKNRRICLLREDGVNLFKFEMAMGLKKYVCTMPLSDEALSAMVSLRSDARNNGFVEELKTESTK